MKSIFKGNILMKKIAVMFLEVCMIAVEMFSVSGCSPQEDVDEIILRVSNWEEYIDEGEWDEEEAIELDDGTVICPDKSLVEDFEEWFYDNYHKKVVVEYSTFGTNEELYNQLTLGDVYDVVCPSEYMIMKLVTEGELQPFSDSFFDESDERNYYIRNVSPFIKERFDELEINGEALTGYAAGYMWGTLGIVYNPEYVTYEQASHWNILLNSDFYKQITIKDSVRDAYFAGAAIYNYDKITDEDFINNEDYYENLSACINATDKETVDAVEAILSEAQKNVYSFETDSGKADLATGKVVANQQWSGDAVYTMDQAEEDGVELCYAAPLEATNLWFDGWCMLKKGLAEDSDKQLAAEAFINYMAYPENAIRNMYYIGYTSTVSGKTDGMIEDYINYCYAAEDDEEDTMEYDISYFFGKETIIVAPTEQVNRQLAAQYPTEDVTDRSVVMAYFDKEGNERINRMWTNVRCFDLDAIFD